MISKEDHFWRWTLKRFFSDFCRCNCLWCFDDDHDDMMQLLQMGFSRLNSRQNFKITSHNIKMITSILGREFLIELAKGLAK